MISAELWAPAVLHSFALPLHAFSLRLASASMLFPPLPLALHALAASFAAFPGFF